MVLGAFHFNFTRGEKGASKTRRKEERDRKRKKRERKRRDEEGDGRHRPTRKCITCCITFLLL